MDKVAYWLIRGLLLVIGRMPLWLVAGLGRFLGGLAYHLDRRHRRVALDNLRMVFGKELSPHGRRALAKENFRRIGENYAAGVRTMTMEPDEIERHLEILHGSNFLPKIGHDDKTNCIVAIGHFGNFELYARANDLCKEFFHGLNFATTYRGFRQESLEALFKSLRERSGCTFYERRRDVRRLRRALDSGGMMLGLLSDQHAGRRGVRLDFLGHECSVSTAPAVFALRYNSPLHTAVCFRVGPAKWVIEVGPEIPTREDGRKRSTEDIMRDVNRVFEEAIRRDPANWFWVHKRWKGRQ